jgi:UDPglucose 6-dehydrogenase
VVVGCNSKRAEALMRKLYEPFTAKRGRNGPERMLVMDVRSAELTKYAANAMLATRISFMNELAQVAERVGADIENVRRGIGADTRIGNSFISPGTGYGGSCFPKDVKALVRAAHTVGYEPAILNAVEAVNDRQKHVLVGKLRRIYGDNLAGRCLAVWGLAFKPDTDDMREAPSVVIIHELLAAGATVRVHDPVAMTEARRELGAVAGITWCTDHFEAATGADALLIVTEWQVYRNASLTRLRSVLKAPRIFDGRNLHDPARMARLKFEYYAIGRGLQAVV